jgi:hypothetical protein
VFPANTSDVCVCIYQIAHRNSKEKEKTALKESESLVYVEQVLHSVFDILEADGEGAGGVYVQALENIQNAERDLNKVFLNLDANPGGLTSAIESIVRTVGRLFVVKNTSYKLAGYSFMDGIMLMVFVLMTIADWPLEKQAQKKQVTSLVIYFRRS